MEPACIVASYLVILSHSVCDFGSVISVDFFSVISDFGRHRAIAAPNRFVAMQIVSNLI